MFLIDTNIWIERILDQSRAAEVSQFFDRVPSGQLFITDFAFHSIGVILGRLSKVEVLPIFVEDIFFYGAVTLVHLEPDDVSDLVHTIRQFNLDFDDAYQYVAAEKHDLTIISFDADFDRTPRGRRLPVDIA